MAHERLGLPWSFMVMNVRPYVRSELDQNSEPMCDSEELDLARIRNVCLMASLSTSAFAISDGL